MGRFQDPTSKVAGSCGESRNTKQPRVMAAREPPRRRPWAELKSQNHSTARPCGQARLARINTRISTWETRKREKAKIFGGVATADTTAGFPCSHASGEATSPDDLQQVECVGVSACLSMSIPQPTSFPWGVILWGPLPWSAMENITNQPLE
jgi:hypothetical protein